MKLKSKKYKNRRVHDEISKKILSSPKFYSVLGHHERLYRSIANPLFFIMHPFSFVGIGEKECLSISFIICDIELILSPRKGEEDIINSMSTYIRHATGYDSLTDRYYRDVRNVFPI